MDNKLRLAHWLCLIFALFVIGIALIPKQKVESTSLPTKQILVSDSNLYPETAIVTSITNDIVTVKTSSGNSFAFVGAEDYEVNDIVSMLMYDNDTPVVYDDGIVKVQYSGRFN